jgi:hypothetical protein
MSHLRAIFVEKASESDLIWIDKLSSFSYYEETTKSLIQRGLTGNLGFWRIVGEDLDGIIAARIVQRGELREFWIEFIHGKGLLKKWVELYQDLWELARMAACTRVSWMCPPAHTKTYQRIMGVRPVSIIFSEDQSNAQG